MAMRLSYYIQINIIKVVTFTSDIKFYFSVYGGMFREQLIDKWCS